MKMQYLSGLILLLIQLSFLNSTFGQTKKAKPISIIFETDMGNDIDDALALDMLYKYQDQGIINLLGIGINKNSPYSVPFVDVMNKWYNYPNIPIGAVKNGANSEGDAKNYAELTIKYTENGKQPFTSNKTESETIDAVEMYRKLLSKQADNSVVIASVGFSTNLAKLLNSKADKHSKLTGEQLVAKKVKLLSVMAGNFNPDTAQRFVEYNVAKDVPAAREMFAKWPTQIVISPFELGDHIKYPAKSIQEDFNDLKPHPMVIAYESYLKMPYDRSTWDLTSVLYAVEGNSKGYFNLSKKGKMTIAANGKSFFEEGSGNHIILSTNQQQQKLILDRFIELITKKSKNK